MVCMWDGLSSNHCRTKKLQLNYKEVLFFVEIGASEKTVVVVKSNISEVRGGRPNKAVFNGVLARLKVRTELIWPRQLLTRGLVVNIYHL